MAAIRRCPKSTEQSTAKRYSLLRFNPRPTVLGNITAWHQAHTQEHSPEMAHGALVQSVVSNYPSAVPHGCLITHAPANAPTSSQHLMPCFICHQRVDFCTDASHAYVKASRPLGHVLQRERCIHSRKQGRHHNQRTHYCRKKSGSFPLKDTLQPERHIHEREQHRHLNQWADRRRKRL